LDFSAKKLPKEAAENMRSCPIESVQPYALMLAPAYVFLRQNQKFIALKEPLDFFTPEELQKVSSLHSFFFPEFVDQALTFRDRAKTVRAIFTWKPTDPDRALPPPSSFETSDSILKLVGPLWSQDVTIEPFFVVVFINELLDLLPAETLIAVRDRDLEIFDRALTVSAWATFLAIHLGYCELGFLSAFRMEVFREVAGLDPEVERTEDLNELKVIAKETAFSAQSGYFSAETFLGREERAAYKIAARLRRVQEHLVIRNVPAASIHGQKGFANG
jgi:hypothetical protein